MKSHAKFSELRELLKVAKQLRKAATQTCDNQYRMLFIRTAAGLEDHARTRAFGPHSVVVPREGHYFADALEEPN